VDENVLRERVAEIAAMRPGSNIGPADEATNLIISGGLTVVCAAYGPASPQARHVEDVIRRRGKDGYSSYTNALEIRGAVQNLQRDLEAGLVGSMRRTLAGEVSADMVGLARRCLDDDHIEPAAVLAAAVYEDTIRRMGTELASITDRPKLEQVLTTLKEKGVTSGSQVGIAQGYLNFRNNALHADWKKIDRESIQSVLGFVEGLLLKHFS
jgi:hypothetical protein